MANGGMMKMMKQLQKAQAEISRMQAELEERTVESSSGGGAVRVVIDGSKTLVSLQIDPEAISVDDKELLEDMIMAAVNEAYHRVEEMVNTEMRRITGELNLPPGMI